MAKGNWHRRLESICHLPFSFCPLPFVGRASLMRLPTALAIAMLATFATAQEPSGLAAVAAIEDAFVKAIEQSEPSVVAISRKRARPGMPRQQARAFDRFRPVEIPEPTTEQPDLLSADWGAGIVVGEDGLILTNLHVVSGGPVEGRGGESEFVLQVHLADRREFFATIRAADPRSDLAVIKIAADNLKPIKLGDGSKLKKGQLVVALGNPYTLAGDGSASASWGIVANVSRRAALEGRRSGEDPFHFNTLLQIDARLNLGTSGGAVINLRGELVGVTTSLAALAGYEKTVGFAVPVDDWLRRVIDTLKKGLEVEYGFLGISPAELEMAARNGIRTDQINQPGAAFVADAHQNSPASHGKVRSGDLILAVNDRPILSVPDLLREVGKLAPGDTARLRVWRPDERREVTLPVVLGKWPVPDHEQVIATQRRYPAWRGLVVDYPTARYRFSDPRRQPQPAVLITEVDPDTPAANSNLQPGSFIVQVNGTPVRTPQEFHDIVKSLPGPVTLDMIVGDTRVTRQLPR
jgi:serine protease Do